MTIKCDKCGKELKRRGIKYHVWRVHGEGVNLKTNLGKPTWNKGLTKETDERVAKGSLATKRYMEENGHPTKGRKLSSEHKKKVSIGRKKHLNSDKYDSWKVRKGKENSAERAFREVLERFEGLKIHQYYNPPELDRAYEIDFAIVNLKIAFEVNGTQHYDSNGELTEYHQKRHDYLTGDGWKVLEVPYQICFNSEYSSKLISSFLEGDYNFSEQKCSEIINCILKNREEKREELRLKREKSISKKLNSIKKRKDITLNSDIKFGKKGWLTELSKLFGINQHNTSRWLNKHMPDFYSLYKKH